MKSLYTFRTSITRIRVGATLTLAAVLALAFAGTPAIRADNAVVYWSGIAEGAIAVGRPPASSSVLGGIVHGAMYDAVAAIEGGLTPFATGVTAPPGASADAAVAQAARDILVARVPLQATNVQNAYDSFMTWIPDGSAKDGGKAVGAAAAAGMLAMRTGDHFDDIVAYVQPTPGRGVFEPIAPTTPVDVKLGRVRPFTYSSPSDYRPGAPYRLRSKRYAQDVAELQEVGRVDSTIRTAEQTETVRFFTDQTFLQYSRALRGLVNSLNLDLRESARLLGYVHVSIGDTMIACWEAKYYYYFWRPTHAIQRADIDGNPATFPDATWLPLVTGNHPEYPSGHACFTTAMTTSLRKYFGTKHVPIAISSTVVGTTRIYQSLDELTADVENARVWGGLHYRTTMTQSAEDFKQIARDIGRRYFLADRSSPGEDEAGDRDDHHR